nr:hypothetical protein [Tanacetum cinerariifolium]
MGNTSGQAKVVKCYNCQALAEGKELDEKQLAFLADPGVTDGQVAQIITYNAAFQTDDLDAYDSDCNDISFTKAVLMANLSSCDSDILYEALVQNTNTFAQQNSMILSMFEQMSNHATNWDKANNESKIVNESLTDELERYKERVKILEQGFNVDLSSHEKFIDSRMDEMIRMKNTKFELLVYVSKTCHSLTKPSEKSVAVTPLNKDKKVRFADPIISLSNTQSQVNPHKTKDSNQPLLHSTGVISSTGASGSKPTGNTRTIGSGNHQVATRPIK